MDVNGSVFCLEQIHSNKNETRQPMKLIKIFGYIIAIISLILITPLAGLLPMGLFEDSTNGYYKVVPAEDSFNWSWVALVVGIGLVLLSAHWQNRS